MIPSKLHFVDALKDDFISSLERMEFGGQISPDSEEERKNEFYLMLKWYAIWCTIATIWFMINDFLFDMVWALLSNFTFGLILVVYPVFFIVRAIFTYGIAGTLIVFFTDKSFKYLKLGNLPSFSAINYVKNYIS
jgi:hypothetical protein